MARKNKSSLLKIEEFFAENQLNIVENQRAYEILLTVIGSYWEGKILIKEIKKPLWTLLIGSKIFSRNLTMLLSSQNNIKKLEEKFAYKPIFKIEVDSSLLAEFREKPAKTTIALPPKPKKGEGKKGILEKYLNFDIKNDDFDKIIKNKNYRNYKKAIYEYINEGNLINLPIEENNKTNKKIISLETNPLFLEIREIIKNNKENFNTTSSKTIRRTKKRKDLIRYIQSLNLEE